MLSRREQSGEIMCLDTFVFVFVFLKLSGIYYESEDFHVNF